MSNIYLCQDTHLFGKIWAIKEFTASYADPQEQANALQHFEREARMLSSLSHPNLPTINEYFQYQGHYYLAMEYINGQDLGKLLEKNNGPLPELDVADWGMQCATVLYYLHCQKPDPIIFRDVKPSNIIIVQGTVKLIDFGIARVFDRNKRGDTMRIGSPGYAPPEQYNGSTDQRSDIFALGMTMHHALTGKDPTLSPNPFVIPKISSVNPAVSPELADIVEKAVKLVPEERYQSMLELKNALRGFLSVKRGDGLRGRTTPNLIVPTSNPTPSPAPSTPTPTPNPPTQTSNNTSNQTTSNSANLPPTRAINTSSSIPVNSHKLNTNTNSPISVPPQSASKPIITPIPPKSSKFGKFCKFVFYLICLTVIATSVLISSNMYPLSLPQFVLENNSSRSLSVYSPIYNIQAVLQGNYRLDSQDIRTIYKYVPDRSFVRRELLKTIERNRDNLEAKIMYENILAGSRPALLDLVVNKEDLNIAELGTYWAQKQIRRQGGLNESLLCVHIFANDDFSKILPLLKEPLNCRQNDNYNGFNAPNIISTLDNQDCEANITPVVLSPDKKESYISPLTTTIKEKNLKGKFYTADKEIYADLKASGYDVIQKSLNDLSKNLSGYWFIEGSSLREEELKKFQGAPNINLIALFPTYNDLLNSQSCKHLQKTKSSEAWTLLSPLHPHLLAQDLLSSGIVYDSHNLTFFQTQKILQIYDSLMRVALKQKGISGNLRGALASYSPEI
ncbi:protein kinase [bacterium]|nr:protein kinase [bacterium]